MFALMYFVKKDETLLKGANFDRRAKINNRKYVV
jgi:hypothetical protein